MDSTVARICHQQVAKAIHCNTAWALDLSLLTALFPVAELDLSLWVINSNRMGITVTDIEIACCVMAQICREGHWVALLTGSDDLLHRATSIMKVEAVAALVTNYQFSGPPVIGDAKWCRQMTRVWGDQKLARLGEDFQTAASQDPSPGFCHWELRWLPKETWGVGFQRSWGYCHCSQRCWLQKPHGQPRSDYPHCWRTRSSQSLCSLETRSPRWLGRHTEAVDDLPFRGTTTLSSLGGFHTFEAPTCTKCYRFVTVAVKPAVAPHCTSPLKKKKEEKNNSTTCVCDLGLVICLAMLCIGRSGAISGWLPIEMITFSVNCI